MSAPSLGWVCSGCGRKVPGTIRSCRCGARREASPSSDSPRISGLSLLRDKSRLAAAGVGIAVVLVACGWLLRGGPSTEEDQELESTESAAVPAFDPVPPSEPSVDPPAPPAARPLEEVVEEVIPSVVSISSSEGRGSGFFVDQETIVTNYHVVGEDNYVDVKLSGGEVVSGRVEEVSAEWDLALIEAQMMGEDARGLPIVGSDEVRVGQDVLVIGSPLGVLENSVTRGIVSAVRSSEEITLIQIDAPINPGNSGGPVIDRFGRVIGIATMKAERGESIGFAVASQHATELIENGARPVSRASSASSAKTDQTSAPPNLEEMNEQQLVAVMETILQHYDDYYMDLWKAVSQCSNLATRFRGLEGNRLRFELGRLVLEYVDQRRIYSRDRDQANIPSWSDMTCIEREEPSIRYCFEGIVIYDQVYDEYVSRRASQGKSPAVERHFPEI